MDFKLGKRFSIRLPKEVLGIPRNGFQDSNWNFPLDWLGLIWLFGPGKKGGRFIPGTFLLMGFPIWFTPWIRWKELGGNLPRLI